MSLGGPGYDPANEEIARLLQDAGILWVVPAGNGEAGCHGRFGAAQSAAGALLQLGKQRKAGQVPQVLCLG